MKPPRLTFREKIRAMCRGAGSLLDLFPAPPRIDWPDEPESIEEAFEQDAEALRQDFERAMGRRK